jgi:hypothetical protein
LKNYSTLSKQEYEPQLDSEGISVTCAIVENYFINLRGRRVEEAVAAVDAGRSGGSAAEVHGSSVWLGLGVETVDWYEKGIVVG